MSAKKKQDIELNTGRGISYLQAAMYYVVYKINNYNCAVLSNFPKSFIRFSKIHRLLSEGYTNVSDGYNQIFRGLLEISKEDLKMLQMSWCIILLLYSH